MDGGRVIADAFESTLRGYIDGVLDGRIVVSSLVRRAVQRHVNDLSRQSTQDFPYHFDERHAAKVCRFYPSVLRHSIGRYSGMPFELEPWQLFCESCIFGWKRDADETRRFRRSYESVGRKNGKSTRAAGRALFMARYDSNPVAARKLGKAFVPEPVSQVVLCATKKEQAERVAFAEILRMRRASPSVSKASTDVRRQIQFADNDGEIICVGSDRPYDGLNPHYVHIDELHAWCEFHRPFYDTMLTGSGFRDQPLIAYTTTAGDERSYLWKEVYDYAKKVATGEVQDDSFFSFCAELDEGDDVFDEANWIKANPNIGVSVSLEYLRDQAREAKTSPIATNRFTRYHGNRIVSSIEQAFDLGEWDACRGELSDWSTADAIGVGVDLGARDDLAAEAYCARFPIGELDGKAIYRYEVKVTAHIADDTSRDLSKQPFSTWVYDEKLKKSRYPLANLRDSVAENCRNWNAKIVAYDPYNGQSLAEELEREGLTPARMAQNQSNFNEPIRDFLQAVKDKRVRHDGNPLLRWCVGNAAISRDRQDRWMFDKRSSSEKIDAAVAMVMAFRVACLAQPRAIGSLYL